jgi:hypothetical protein
MTFLTYLATSIHQSRKARLALKRGNLPAAQALVNNAHRHVGSADAVRPRPSFLTPAAQLHRIAVAQSVANSTSEMILRGVDVDASEKREPELAPPMRMPPTPSYHRVLTDEGRAVLVARIRRIVMDRGLL